MRFIIYGHNHKSLGVTSILYPFSKIIVIDSPLGSVTCLDTGFVLQ